LQKRLYTISPESVQSNGKGKANPERRVSALTTGNHHKVNRTIDRLIVKLNKIKADILFDASEASRRWADCQVDLAREAADRRRLGIRDGIDPKEEVPPIDISNQAEALDNDEDNADMLEGLFDSLPASTNGLGVRAEGTGSEGLGKELVNIRDFGKWTGLSPRRILEEACKSR